MEGRGKRATQLLGAAGQVQELHRAHAGVRDDNSAEKYKEVGWHGRAVTKKEAEHEPEGG